MIIEPDQITIYDAMGHLEKTIICGAHTIAPADEAECIKRGTEDTPLMIVGAIALIAIIVGFFSMIEVLTSKNNEEKAAWSRYGIAAMAVIIICANIHLTK